MKPDFQRPSLEEYVSFVENRFRFLEEEYGFRKSWDTRDRFRVAYSNGVLRVDIWGWGWGESGHASLSLGDEGLPFHRIVTPLNQKLLATTGKPQLDDLQELAIRFEKQCADLLRGYILLLLPLCPFPRSDELRQKLDYSTLVDRLRKFEVPLSPEWQNRFEYALKNT